MFAHQIKQEKRYKKRWYFWHQYKKTVAREPAETCFTNVSRSVALRVIRDFVDIANGVTGPNDCWISNEKLVNNESGARLRIDELIISCFILFVLCLVHPLVTLIRLLTVLLLGLSSGLLL